MYLASNPTIAVEFGHFEYDTEFEDISKEGIKKITDKCSEFQAKAKQFMSESGINVIKHFTPVAFTTEQA